MPPFFAPMPPSSAVATTTNAANLCPKTSPYFVLTHALISLELAFFIKSKTCALFWGHFPLSRAQVQAQLEAANVRVPHVRISEYMYTYVCAVAVRMYVLHALLAHFSHFRYKTLPTHDMATCVCDTCIYLRVCVCDVFECVCAMSAFYSFEPQLSKCQDPDRAALLWEHKTRRDSVAIWIYSSWAPVDCDYSTFTCSNLCSWY